MTLEHLKAVGRTFDYYVLARYFYRIGEPILDDSSYEELENIIKNEYYFQASEYLNRSYDDDPVPTALLNEIGVTPIQIAVPKDKKELFEYLNSEKSLSINSVTTYDEAFVFFRRYRAEHKDLVTSIKLDGDNVKTLYLDSRLRLSLSRGRGGGVSFDFTNTIANVFPQSLERAPHDLKIYAEAFVEPDYLPVLRRKYNLAGYKTSKSAAISLLRVQHDAEDYKHLKVIVHGVEGVGDSVTESFEIAKKWGFTIVKHKLIHWEDIPADMQEFKVWLKNNVFDYFEKEAAEFPSDGVVVEVNDLHYTGIVSGQYTDRQLALKFEQWSYKCYKGIIEDICWEQKRVLASCRIKIRPMKTDDGCSANYINGFNFSILAQEGLTIGSEVYYVRNSGAVNILVYGKDLDRLLGR